MKISEFKKVLLSNERIAIYTWDNTGDDLSLYEGVASSIPDYLLNRNISFIFPSRSDSNDLYMDVCVKFRKGDKRYDCK